MDKKIRRNILNVIVSPKTSAILKLGIAVIGIISAVNELKSCVELEKTKKT